MKPERQPKKSFSGRKFLLPGIFQTAVTFYFWITRNGWLKRLQGSGCWKMQLTFPGSGSGMAVSGMNLWRSRKQPKGRNKENKQIEQEETNKWENISI